MKTPSSSVQREQQKKLKLWNFLSIPILHLRNGGRKEVVDPDITAANRFRNPKPILRGEVSASQAQYENFIYIYRTDSLYQIVDFVVVVCMR